MTSTNNPWAEEEAQIHNSQQHSSHILDQPNTNPWQLQGQTDQHNQQQTYTTPSDPWSQSSEHQGYAPPAGPPPSHRNAPASKLPDETARFVPDAERGEQREALEQFEMSHQHQQTSDERNIELLTQQFPKLDGALVAAIYGDSKDMGASREMLGELSEQMK